MPRTSVKQRLVKWFLATLDAEIEGYQKLTLASYLDGELAMLVAVPVPPRNWILIGFYVTNQLQLKMIS